MAINPLDTALLHGINSSSLADNNITEGMNGRPLDPNSADVDFFNQQLADSSSEGSLSSDSVSKTGQSDSVASFLNSFNDSSKSAEDSLQQASKSTTPGQLVDSMRKVSSFDLQSRLLAKMVGDGVKGLDKLTNMQ